MSSHPSNAGLCIELKLFSGETEQQATAKDEPAWITSVIYSIFVVLKNERLSVTTADGYLMTANKDTKSPTNLIQGGADDGL